MRVWMLLAFSMAFLFAIRVAKICWWEGPCMHFLWFCDFWAFVGCCCRRSSHEIASILHGGGVQQVCGACRVCVCVCVWCGECGLSCDLKYSSWRLSTAGLLRVTFLVMRGACNMSYD